MRISSAGKWAILNPRCFEGRDSMAFQTAQGEIEDGIVKESGQNQDFSAF